MDLHGEIGRPADEVVGLVVADRHFVREAGRVGAVHLPGRAEDIVPYHLAFGVELGEGELDRLSFGERLAEEHPALGGLHRLGDAVARRARARRRLADAVLVDEQHRDLQALALLVQDRRVRHAHVLQLDLRMVGRHVEGPVVHDDGVAGRIGRHDEGGDAVGLAVLAAGAGEHEVGLGPADLRIPPLAAVDDPVVAVAHGPRFQPCRVGAVVRLGQRETEVPLPADDALDVDLLIFRAVAGDRRHDREVADDGGLVLQVVVQAETLGGEVLADRCIHQVAGRLAAAAFRKAEPQMAGRLGAALHLRDQRPPFVGRTPVGFPVGARPFPAMVEELHVLPLERLDLGFDEGIELGELVDNGLR